VSRISWLTLRAEYNVDAASGNVETCDLPGYRENTSLMNLTATEKRFVFASQSVSIERWQPPNFHHAIHLERYDIRCTSREPVV
jgi:hypothetical protein